MEILATGDVSPSQVPVTERTRERTGLQPVGAAMLSVRDRVCFAGIFPQNIPAPQGISVNRLGDGRWGALVFPSGGEDPTKVAADFFSRAHEILLRGNELVVRV